MNSIVQSLSACKTFKDTLVNKLHSDYSTKTSQDKLSKELAKIFRTQFNAVSKPNKLFETICSLDSCKHYAQGTQQDCFDLLINMIEYWSEKKQIQIMKLFEGSSSAQVTCSECSNSEWTWDPFAVLNLCLGDKSSKVHKRLAIEELILRWSREEVLDGKNKYICVRCEKATRHIENLTYLAPLQYWLYRLNDSSIQKIPKG